MSQTQQTISPNDLAEAITGRRHISWSQVQKYQQCPMQFRLHYLDQGEPEFQASSLMVGGGFHRALEFHFGQIMTGRPSPNVTMLVERFMQPLREAENVRFNKGEDIDTVLALGRRMIRAFVDSSHSQPRGDVLVVEEEVRASIDSDLPDLLARLDMVELEHDGVIVTDFKTSKSRWNEGKLLENAAQLQLYGHLLAQTGLGSAGPIRLRFLVVTKAVNPAVQVLDVPHDPERVERELQQVQEIGRTEVPSGVDLAQWALAWCLRQPAVTSVIPGCKTVQHLESNAAAASLDLVRADHPLAVG